VAAAVLAIVTPLGVLAPLSVQRQWRRQLASVDRQHVATVRAISIAIDQHVDRTAAALDVLGELHALDSPDYAAFEDLAARILPYQSRWSSILLADVNGNLLDAVPDRQDAEARVDGQPWARATAAKKAPTVSNLFSLPGQSSHYLIVATPVIRQGKVTFVLGARVDTRGFGEILRQQDTPTNGVAAIIDADHRIIARNSDEDEYVGTPATQAFIDESGKAETRAWRTTLRDGRPIYAAFTRSARTGLRVGLGLASEEVDGPIRRILIYFALAWAAILLLGAALGYAMGQVVVRALSSASQAAMALARGEAVSAAPSRIAEIDELAAGLRRAAGVLAQRNRERDDASRLKDEFLMTISHELRTPLTAICGWARMLATGEIREAQKPKAIASIERNAVALQHLVDELLDMSQIVAGKMHLEIEQVSLGEIVAAAVDTVRPAADSKGIQVRTDLASECGLVPGDARRLQQVVWNLMSNAVKFTGGGGRVDVSCRQTSGHVEIAVTDTGIGIDREFVPYVFERFRQGATGATRSHAGLGLGLSIVRDIVQLHGGAVTAENNVPPPGATFRVTLPLATASPTYSGVAAWDARVEHALPAISPAAPSSPKTAAR
jgi:signal transduction histidine kinase